MKDAAVKPPAPFVRSEHDAEERWFFGGGLHRRLVTAADTGGAFFLFEDRLEPGKTTPLHRHPEADETLYVLEGEITVSIGGREHTVGAGGVSFAPRGTPHAFLVTSNGARVLTLQAPGASEAFFLDASTTDLAETGTVDIARVQESATRHDGTDLLGPPPFASR